MAPAPANITARRRHFADDRLAALLDINRQLALAPGLDQVLQRIVEAAGRLLSAEATGLRLVEGDQLVRAASFGAGGAIMARERLPIGESLSGRVVAEGRSIVSPDLCEDPRYDPIHRTRARAQGLRAWLGVPLRGRDGIVGVLFVVTHEARRFGRAEVELLEAFADQAALAVENARLFQQEQERRRQLEAIGAVTTEITRELNLEPLLGLIIQHAADLAGAESGVVYLWNEPVERLVPRAWQGLGAWVGTLQVSLGEGAVGIAARQRSGLIVNDYRGSAYAHPLAVERSSIEAVLAEPIVYQGKLVGAITVNRERRGDDFVEQDHDLLKLFADQAAVAVENARLVAASERRAAEATALAEVGRALSGSLDLRAVIGLIVDHACRLVGAQRAALALVASDRDCSAIRFVARRGMSERFREEMRPRHWRDGTTPRAIAERRPVWSSDILADAEVDLAPETRAAIEHEGYRSVLSVPLLHGARTLGALVVYRDTVGPFSAEEIDLLAPFAAQAAIALENARLYAAAEHLSLTDTLTGIPNRRHFDQALAEEVARADRHGEPLSLLLADIDHFKPYNDTHGHQAGDEALRTVANALGRSARSTDVVARYGGEEFAILLPNTDATGARAAAEKVRRAVVATGLRLTISVGGAVRPTPDRAGPADPTAARLIAAADAALYGAKRAGRDRAVIA